MEKATNPVIMLSYPPSSMGGICAQKFRASILRRNEYPLKAGLYKLKESLIQIDAFEEEIEILARKFRCKQPLLGKHTYGDHIPWLRKIPLYISEEMGHNIIPAIYALEADGVDSEKLAAYKKQLGQPVTNTLNECEKAMQIIRQPIKHEYAKWSQGSSCLSDSIYYAQRIIETAMNLALIKDFRSMGLEKNKNIFLTEGLIKVFI